MTEKKVIQNKDALFALQEPTLHYVKVAPESDEYLKVWVKEPTWLQVEQALSSVMDVDAGNQSFGLDLNKMYKFMVENFVEKTEPSLSAVDLLRLSPFIGAQLKEVLPNPFTDIMGDDLGNEN